MTPLYDGVDVICHLTVTGVKLFSLFFQAEDGIRDLTVTGVQTCALFIQAEDGIRDLTVTGVQTFALFFQAEDGIRDLTVTGVQTCALPICQWRDLRSPPRLRGCDDLKRLHPPARSEEPEGLRAANLEAERRRRRSGRSEERRVGKECRSRWSPYH